MPPVDAPGVALAGDRADPAGDIAVEDSSGGTVRWSLEGWRLLALLIAAVALPLVVAVVALHRIRWYPVLDMTMTEVRVRDVGTSHTPLIGLPGRIGTLAQQGSHPGPLSFYALAPFYRLFGSSAWALEVATAALNTIAIGLVLWLARRRGGTTMVVAFAVLLAALVRGYGVVALTQAWNPYLPLLWWVVVLLAVWSVVSGDYRVIPIAVVAGSFCAQTHLPYLGLGLGMGALAVVAAVVLVRRAPRGSESRRVLVRSLAIGFAVGAALWSPLVIDQVRHDPGNLTLLKDYFQHPPEQPVGLRTGVRLELLHLDVTKLVDDHRPNAGWFLGAAGDPDGSVVPGLVLLAVWAGSVLVAWRRRLDRLLRLDLVIAAGTVLAVIAMSRIFGHLWYYLMLWSWPITLLMLFAIGWTAAEVVRGRTGADAFARYARLSGIAAVAIIAVSSLALANDARRVQHPDQGLSRVLAAVMPPTERALLDHTGTATGRDGRYAVTWSDALYIGSQGYSIVSELERDGFTAGAPSSSRVPMTPQRVIDPMDATAVVHLATGPFIDQWRARPDAIEVAFFDPRSPEQLDEFNRTRTETITMLRAAGLDDIIPDVDANVFRAAIDDRLTTPENQPIQERLQHLLDLGMPTAIFLAPPGTGL